ncbi:MAG: hypothetical protein RI904_1139 [Pseudomonadota bacterium]
MSNNQRRHILLGGAALATTAMLPNIALAQTSNYPTRPITFIVPWPPGGTADATMRALAQALTRELGQTVVVENKAGAAGMIGAKALATAKPDGYTIGQIPLSITRFSQLGSAQIDPAKVVRPESPIKTLKELVDFAKKNPDQLTYATSGIAGQTHVGMEEFAMAAGIKLRHIPYKGGAPALQALLGGQVDMLADSSAWAPQVEAGKLRLLATWGEQRLKRFPNVPTLKDLGFPVVTDAPNGVGAPAGLDPTITKKLGIALEKAVNSEEFKTACDRIDAPVLYLNADQYRAYIMDIYKKEGILIDKLQLKKLLAG